MNKPDVTDNPQTPATSAPPALLEAPCECLNWPRGITPEKSYGRTKDGVPLLTNHHPNCQHYNDSLIDVWKVTVDGSSCYVDNEQDALDTVGDSGTVSQEKMHKEIFEHLPEFEGF